MTNSGFILLDSSVTLSPFLCMVSISACVNGVLKFFQASARFLSAKRDCSFSRASICLLTLSDRCHRGSSNRNGSLWLWLCDFPQVSNRVTNSIFLKACVNCRIVSIKSIFDCFKLHSRPFQKCYGVLLIPIPYCVVVTFVMYWFVYWNSRFTTDNTGQQ